MGCPHCGNEDIQVMELLQAWKENERLEKLLHEQSQSLLTAASRHPQEKVVTVEKIVYVEKPVIPVSANLSLEVTDNQVVATEEQIAHICETVWKQRYEAIREAYIKTRLDVSGSFGNWSGDTRRRVLENEISAELGFRV